MKLVGLGDSAQSLLALFATELTSLGVSVPDAQYVGAGVIPWDGESLTIGFGSLGQGQPGRPQSASYISPDEVMTFVTMHVQIIRAVSTFGYGSGIIQLPEEEQMQVEGVTAFNDAGALYQAAVNIKANGKVVPLGIDFTIGVVTPLGPDGGLASMSLALDVSVDGV